MYKVKGEQGIDFDSQDSGMRVFGAFWKSKQDKNKTYNDLDSDHSSAKKRRKDSMIEKCVCKDISTEAQSWQIQEKWWNDNPNGMVNVI